MNPQSSSPKVLLKVVKVIPWNKRFASDTNAILDNGSQCAILVPATYKQLGLEGPTKYPLMCIIRQKTEAFDGESVSFEISPSLNPQKTFSIKDAFTSDELLLVD